MSGINKAIIVGRLGKDPEMKYLSGGDAVCNFSVATSEEWKDKTTGEKRSKTEWHRIVAFRKLGEICGAYLEKGKLVYLEGKIQTRSWEKDGEKHYVTEIIADNMQMLGGGKGDSAGDGNSGRSGGQREDWPAGEDDIPF